MNKQQQELYEKLLKKVNEYCLGCAAEDVIAAIDALVETYEKPKKRTAKTKRQLLDENEMYQYLFHEIKYYVESKEFTLDLLAKTLEAIKIIKTKVLGPAYFEIIAPRCELTKEEYELLKEVLK